MCPPDVVEAHRSACDAQEHRVSSADVSSAHLAPVTGLQVLRYTAIGEPAPQQGGHGGIRGTLAQVRCSGVPVRRPSPFMPVNRRPVVLVSPFATRSCGPSSAPMLCFAAPAPRRRCLRPRGGSRRAPAARTSLHSDQRGTPPHNSQELSEEGGSPPAQLFVLLRACDRFAATYERFPGACESDDRAELEQDAARLKDFAAAVMQARCCCFVESCVIAEGLASLPPFVLSRSGESRVPGSATILTTPLRLAQPPPLPPPSLPQDVGCPGVAVNDDYLAEMVRLGAGELHCVGALVGGVAAQEAIKLITAQFVPLDGALVFDGISSTTKVVPLG